MLFLIIFSTINHLYGDIINNSVYLSNKGLIFESNGLEVNLIVLVIISPFIVHKYIKINKNSCKIGKSSVIKFIDNVMK